MKADTNGGNAPERPKVDDEKRMTFTEHLGELRTRLIRACAALGVAVIVSFIFSNFLIEQLARPLAPLALSTIESAPAAPPAPALPGTETPPPAEGKETKEQRQLEWTVLSPLEPIGVQFKIAGYFGLVFSLPFIVWQICAFVFPGLMPNERRVIKILIFGCTGLALGGVAVAYWGVFPLVLPYLLEYALPWVRIQLRLSETIDIIIKGLMGFAVAFQFPMAVLILVYMGLLTPEGLKQYRKITIVVMAVVAAVLTPPDPFSMLIMLFPMVILYEASIILSHIVVRRKKERAESGA